MIWIQIALGGAIGAALRYGIGLFLLFPYATLFVNVLGSFLMGIAFVFLASRSAATPFVMTGILGGFTTFSAFSLDTLKLYEAGRLAAAGGYLAGSVILSLSALILGVVIARGLS